MSGFVIVQSPPNNTSWKPSYLSAFDDDGSGCRSWHRDLEAAHVFSARSEAERIAAGVRKTFDTARGWHVDVCPVGP